MQKWLFEILNTNVIYEYLGTTVLSIVITYSFCKMPSIELNTITWFLDGFLKFILRKTFLPLKVKILLN